MEKKEGRFAGRLTLSYAGTKNNPGGLVFSVLQYRGGLAEQLGSL
jgi:hypothetical protein